MDSTAVQTASLELILGMKNQKEAPQEDLNIDAELLSEDQIKRFASNWKETSSGDSDPTVHQIFYSKFRLI